MLYYLLHLLLYTFIGKSMWNELNRIGSIKIILDKHLVWNYIYSMED